MNALINYFVEANAILVVFLGLYFAFFRQETDFRSIRLIMLTGLIVSVILPVIHLNPATDYNIIPSIGNAIPVNWLPAVEIRVIASDFNTINEGLTSWNLILMIYLLGVSISLWKSIMGMIRLTRLIRSSERESFNGYHIAMIPGNSTFSFLNTICIGNETGITEAEKRHIIRHELVHVQQFHSIDILVAKMVGIIFWFNPFINTYKKIFVQLHEFEADARAVENDDVNRYCSLLARVAIQSAGLTLANHFNNSLTVKRIQMMRTLKTKIRRWKLLVCLIALPSMFVVIACQDQIETGQAAKIPKEAQSRFEIFKKNFPGETFMVEYNEKANSILAELEQKHGSAKHIELFTLTEGNKLRTFSMIQYEGNRSVSGLQAPPKDGIYTVVEEQPEFPGGHDAMIDFIMNNLRYPAEARMKGIEGTSFVQFIVEKDGAITNVQTIRGIDAACDAESVRMVKSFPKWNPGKQKGEPVAVRFVIPIKYKLN